MVSSSGSKVFLTVTAVLFLGLFLGQPVDAKFKKGSKGSDASAISLTKDFGTNFLKCLQDISGEIGKVFESTNFDFQAALNSIMKGPCKELVSGIQSSVGKYNIKLGDFVKMGEMFNSMGNTNNNKV